MVTVPIVYVAAALLAAVLPLALLVAMVVDVVKRRWRFGTTRSVAFVSYCLVGETLFLPVCFAEWLLAPGWTDAGARRLRRWSESLGNRWGRWLHDGGRCFFDLEATVTGLEVFDSDRPQLVFLRHASLGDTVLSPVFIGALAKRRLRYVVKRELLFDPMFDVIGNRVGTCFVRRGSTQGAREIEAVCALADTLRGGDALVVYPEGTRFSEEKRAHAVDKIAAQLSPELLAQARAFTHVLPPRLGGPLALLARRPDADVVFCAHAGYEAAATWSQVLQGRAIGARLSVAFRRVAAEDIPRDRDACARWLYAEWARIDAWVAQHLPDSGAVDAADLERASRKCV